MEKERGVHIEKERRERRRRDVTLTARCLGVAGGTGGVRETVAVCLPRALVAVQV